MPWFFVVLLVVALEVVAYVIMPKPKQPKPAAAQDLQTPTADAGRPQPWIFGTLTIKGTNVLWWGDKSSNTYQVNS